MCELIQEKKPTEENSSTPYKEGLYFNMPEEEYFKIPYYSRSGSEDVLFDVEEYWHNSPMNPDHVPTEPTEAMQLGTAIHCSVLESNRYGGLYVIKPKPEDFKGKKILKTSEDIKAFLVAVGQKKTGNKEELMDRAADYADPKLYVIWDKVINDFNAEAAANGRRILSTEHGRVITGIQTALKRRPQMKTILEDTKSEVVIIWKDEETGIMCKCMLDAVRPEAIGEVKSFSVKRKKTKLGRAMTKAIEDEAYNYQYYVYRKALGLIIRKINLKTAGVFGEVDPEWLERFLKHPDKQFFIMFFRTQAPFQCKTFEMEKAPSLGATPNEYYDQAETLWREGIEKFQWCCKTFGVSRWIAPDNIITLTDEHVPRIMWQNSDI